MFLFPSTFERKVNFLGCFLKFPDFAMKNMFWMRDSFAFLATGFNFICSRLKNCLVYQKSIFLVWAVGGVRTDSSKNSFDERKISSNLFCHWKSLMLLESRTERMEKWWKKIKRTVKLKCLYLLRQYLSCRFLLPAISNGQSMCFTSYSPSPVSLPARFCFRI